MTNMANTCIICGEALKTTVEDCGYPESGLPNVTVVGVRVRRCQKCGALEMRLPRIGELYRVISEAIASKQGPLNEEEITFLRKQFSMDVWVGSGSGTNIDYKFEFVEGHWVKR
jgi:hypothetical protein